MTKKPIPIKEYARWAKEQKSEGSNERRGEQNGQEAMWEKGAKRRRGEGGEEAKRRRGRRGKGAKGRRGRRGLRGKCPLFFTAVLDVIGINLLSAYHPKLNEPSKN